MTAIARAMMMLRLMVLFLLEAWSQGLPGLAIVDVPLA
jgi:hypothetical protein